MGENGKIERNKKQKEIKKDKGGAVRFEKEKSDTVNKTRISDCSKERTNKKKSERRKLIKDVIILKSDEIMKRKIFKAERKDERK